MSKTMSKTVYTRPLPPTLPKVMPKHYHGPTGSRIPTGQPHLERLMQMYSIKRPYSRGEGLGYKVFTEQFIMPVARKHEHFVDEIGNVWVDTRTSLKHRTLFTAHTDSVHHEDGEQHVAFDPVTGLISVLDGSCLGADDASGVAMLLHMIENKVPGMFLFTVAEECGGHGARFASDNYDDHLKDFDRAIAFDRRADYSVITHQGWGRCASDEFAEALSAALSNDFLMYAPDDTGVYTDTAEFVDLIAECTNLSIGYLHEHSSDEVQNLYHFQRLADVVLTVAWDDLPVVRKPGQDDAPNPYKSSVYYDVPSAASGDSGYWPTDDWDVQEIDCALVEALDGDPDELVYLAAGYYADEMDMDAATVYHAMLERHIDMGMIHDVDRDLSVYSIEETMLRFACRLTSTH